MLRDGLQRSLQGGLTGSSADTRYALSGNYFDQKRRDSRAGLHARLRVRARSITRRTVSASGVSANASRITTDMGEGGGAYGYALGDDAARTPDELHEPRLRRPARSAARRRSAQHQSAARGAVDRSAQQTVNRVFGSAYARVADRRRVHLSRQLRSRLHAARPTAATTIRGRTARARTSARTARTRASRRRPGCSTRRTSRTRSTTCCSLNATLGSCTTSTSRAVQHPEGPLHEGLDLRDEAAVQHAALVRPRVGHGGQQAEPHLRVVAAVVHGTHQLHAARPLLDLGHRSHRRIEPPRAGAQVGVLPVVRPRVAARRRIVHAAASASSTQLKLRGSYGTTGNTSINPYQTQGTLSSKLYTFGTTRVRGYRPGSIPESRPRRGRRRTRPTSVSTSRCSTTASRGSVDGYVQNTHDLLLTRLLPVTSGFTSTLQNIGSTKNTGLEIRAVDGRTCRTGTA